MIDYLPLVLTGVGIIASILYYASVLRNANKTQQLQLETRQTQIFMQIYQQLNTVETAKTTMELMTLNIKDNTEYLEKYDSTVNLDNYAKRASIWYTYNSIGELLRIGTIDLDLILRLQLDIQVIIMWENWEEIIRATRVRENLPYLWEGFEYLYDELKRYRVSQGFTGRIGPPPDLLAT
jgi:hypothetical protein